MPSAFPALSKKALAPAKKKKVKYCKAPGAPKRFKSAFIFFTMHRHKTIRKDIEEKLGKGDRTPDVAKIISEEWRNMKAEDRAVWDEKARLDKERFEVEKALYTGPWKIPVKQKSQKDPGAPKRPMSSFLSYSNSKRSEIKRTHPGISNSDASKLLAKMWKEAPYEQKREHIEREEGLREIYKREIAEYRKKKKDDIDEVREEREKAALRYIDNRAKGIIDETELLAVSWGPNDGSNNVNNPEQGHYPPQGPYDGAPYGDPYYSHLYHHGPPPPHEYHAPPPPPHGYHGGPPPPPHYYSNHGQPQPPPPPHYPGHGAHHGEGRDAPPPPPPHGHYGYYDDGYGGYTPQLYHHHPPAPAPGREPGTESVPGDAKGGKQDQSHGHPPAGGAPPPMDHGDPAASGYYYSSHEHPHPHPHPPQPPLDGHHYDGGYSEHYSSQQPSSSQDAPPVY